MTYYIQPHIFFYIFVDRVLQVHSRKGTFADRVRNNICVLLKVYYILKANFQTVVH